MTKVAIAIAVGLSLSLILCWPYRVNSTEQVITLGDKTLSVPLRYFDANERTIEAFLRAVPGLDSADREVNLIIDASEIAREIPGYITEIGKYRDNLRLLVSILDEQEIGRYNDGTRFRDIEKRQYSYIDMVTESDPVRKFIRVYRKIEYPQSWAVFGAKVDGFLLSLPNDLHSNWIAHCLESGSPLTESGRLALCKSFVLIDRVAVHFTVTDINLEKIDAIRSLLSRKVLSWQLKQAHAQ